MNERSDNENLSRLPNVETGDTGPVRTTWRTKILWSILLLAVWGCGEPAEESGGERPVVHDLEFKHWAVIASEDVQQQGLSDLLTVELANRESLKLVERDRLEELTAELKRGVLSDSAEVDKRLEVGRLLKADALILLSLQKQKEGSFLKIVIAECRYGARLLLEHLPMTEDDPQRLAAQVAAIVDRTRIRFAGGIKHLIDVGHFVSNNLTHQYDHLQAGYAYLLEHALAELPAVAVIETEEARAIGRELLVEGGELAERDVLLVITGEFEMGPPKAKNDEEASVALTVRISNGDGLLRKIERKALSQQQVNDLLLNDVPRLIVQHMKATPPGTISRQEHLQSLLKRADQFARLAAWEHSTGLREAALLLAPSDTAQRLLIVKEYRQWQRTHKSELVARDPGRSVGTVKLHLTSQEWDQWDPIRAERLAIWCNTMQHTETLMRRQAISESQATRLIREILQDTSTLQITGERVPPEVREALQKFFWDTYPVVAKFAVATTGRQDWRSGAIDYILESAKTSSRWVPAGPDAWSHIRKYDSGQALDNLYRFLAEVVPADAPPSSRMASVFPYRSDSISRGDIGYGISFTDEQLFRFCVRLEESQRPRNVLYGRFGRMMLDHRLLSSVQPDREAALAVIRQADQVLAYLDEHKWGDPRSTFAVETRKIRDNLASKLDVAANPPTPEKPTAKHHKVKSDPRELGFVDTERVWFDPIRVLGRWTEKRHLQKCGNSLDVIWSWREVDVMEEKDVLRRIFQVPKEEDEKSRIRAVCFDGKNFWIAVDETGVRVVSRQGEILGRFNSQSGLPPYESAARWAPGLRLHPIEPGKCIAIGVFDETKRVWFAELALGEGGTADRVNVFHKAIKLTDPQGSPDDTDPSEIFWVTYLLEYPVPNSSQRLLLVGRGPRQGGRPDKRRYARCPLAIDLDTLDVSIFPASIQALSKDWGVQRVNDDLLTTVNGKLYLYQPPAGKNRIDWTEKDLSELLGTQNRSSQIYPFRDKIYWLGSTWYQIDPKTRELQQLTDYMPRIVPLGSPPPGVKPSELVTVSAHYGLVRWFDYKFTQVLLAANGTLTPYAYVPEAKREKHAQAAEAVRQLGGYVARMHTNVRDGDATRVYLPEQWKGGDAGVEHLKDLYRVHELHVIRTPITNEAAKHLQSLNELQLLGLTETAITDEGLAYIMDLSQLGELKLEGTFGGNEFTDAGLERITHLPALKKLNLYGSGFTDRSLSSLERMERLSTLILVDTSLTSEALDRLKRTRPRLKVYGQ